MFWVVSSLNSGPPTARPVELSQREVFTVLLCHPVHMYIGAYIQTKFDTASYDGDIVCGASALGGGLSNFVDEGDGNANGLSEVWTKGARG